MKPLNWFHLTQCLGRFYCLGCRRRVRGRPRWVWARRSEAEPPCWFRAIRRRCVCGRKWAVAADSEFSIAICYAAALTSTNWRAEEGTAER